MSVYAVTVQAWRSAELVNTKAPITCNHTVRTSFSELAMSERYIYNKSCLFGGGENHYI